MSVHPQVFRVEQNLVCRLMSMSDTRWCRMMRSKVRVKVTEVWKLQKWPISKSYLLCQYACNQKTNGGLWWLNFWTDIWYPSSWPSKLQCYQESTSSPIWDFFILFDWLAFLYMLTRLFKCSLQTLQVIQRCEDLHFCHYSTTVFLVSKPYPYIQLHRRRQ